MSSLRGAEKLGQRLSDESEATLEETQEFLLRGNMNYPTYSARNRHLKGFGFFFWVVTCINAVLFPFSAVCSLSAFQWKNTIQKNHDNSLLRLTSWYSPVFDQTQIDIIEKRVNGSLLNLDNSISRAPPSPEIDAAWERISSLMPHVISTEDVIRLGKDPSKTARYPEDWGFGPDVHVAELDILHTIHCLNAIRRDVHWRHYFIDDYPDGNLPELHRVHTDHCIYIVLQNLMCGATPDLITQPWVDGQLHPFPDFNINKKCNEFDSILAWHEDTMITDSARFATMRIPSGQTPLPMSDEFHRMFGLDSHSAGGHDHGHFKRNAY
ncbi:hypothetical protein CGRA01v4_07656 [Colletotrichum graminicola]|uniref:Tat pathway signal sequence n=1 Tax=Colletotrichum graminicola (strain M1.001 / M2 / FGSC 10212) TaxID=645133 RepID=E3QYL2_COLGM|nr:uncharacterized protein GLRG_11094 [Colletotrichum graminicola M1.001]EFQ35950.1 hypothetical protein GLRG_11094 [Colletotrichum graminicola M1.001]WDK16373.1 hypothetical protein CGRA01v4_07656 [Colletotrichum graminicola]